MEYYSSVFTFDDWYLDKPVGTIAQQYDHLSRSILVAGNLPDGYIWHMLVQCGDNFNIVLMEPIEDTASAVADLPEEDGEPEKKPKLIGAVLERGWVGESGKYSVQLRGVKGEEVRHTNLITIRIPKSMAGEAQWPEVPSEFTQIEHRVNETYEKVKNTAAEAEKAKNAIENMGATAKSVEPDEATRATLLHMRAYTALKSILTDISNCIMQTTQLRPIFPSMKMVILWRKFEGVNAHGETYSW